MTVKLETHFVIKGPVLLKVGHYFFSVKLNQCFFFKRTACGNYIQTLHKSDQLYATALCLSDIDQHFNHCIISKWV